MDWQHLLHCTTHVNPQPTVVSLCVREKPEQQSGILLLSEVTTRWFSSDVLGSG